MLINFLVTLSADAKLPAADLYNQVLLLTVFEGVLEKFHGVIDHFYITRDVDYIGPQGVCAPQCRLLFINEYLQTFLLKHYALDGSLRIEFMPASVEHLDIETCQLRCPVQTRYLPRKARYISLSKNGIYGSLDLSGLPQGAESVNISINALSGEISLMFLSDSLRYLDLRGNNFNQEVVHYMYLPQAINKIFLQNANIEYVESISGSKKNDATVFDVPIGSRKRRKH